MLAIAGVRNFRVICGYSIFEESHCGQRSAAVSRDAAAEVNPDILCLCHGGPIAEPDDARHVIDNTVGVVGFFGASSMERLPTEVAMTENMRRFKAIDV